MIFLYCCFELALPVSAGAQAQGYVLRLAPGYRVWLEGTAGPADFSCRIGQVFAEGKLAGVENAYAATMQHGKVELNARFPVKSMDCGNNLMNRDLRNALRADQFPEIRFVLQSHRADATLTEGAEPLVPIGILSTGLLTISGTSRTEQVRVTGERTAPGVFRIRGAIHIDMTLYGVTPPIGLFGLVKVDRMLTVHFDISAALVPAGQSPES